MGGGTNLSSLFGKRVAYISLETVETIVCPVIGIKHIDIESYYGTGTMILYGIDSNDNKTTIWTGGATTGLDVSNYDLISCIRNTGNMSNYYVKYID